MQQLAACIRTAENGHDGYQWGWEGSGDGGGAYQFEPGTWDHANSLEAGYFGNGYGNPGDTSSTNQDNAFVALYLADGTSPWDGDRCVG